MKVKSEREVAQSYQTLSNPKDCSPPGSSIHGIFQARVLEWGAITAQQKDSGSSMWCFEIHPTCRPTDLQVGQTAQVQGLQR